MKKLFILVVVLFSISNIAIAGEPLFSDSSTNLEYHLSHRDMEISLLCTYNNDVNNIKAIKICDKIIDRYTNYYQFTLITRERQSQKSIDRRKSVSIFIAGDYDKKEIIRNDETVIVVKNKRYFLGKVLSLNDFELLIETINEAFK